MTYRRIFKKKKKKKKTFVSMRLAVVPARDPSWTTSPSYSPTSRFIQLCQYR